MADAWSIEWPSMPDTRPPPAAPSPTLIAIAGGRFLMGRDDRRRDERPSHSVELSPFRAAQSAVTNAEYARYLSASAADAPRFWRDPALNPAGQPVVGVSWHEAMAYCAWLGASSGRPYRLPTEAEREFAALGGLSSVDWPWGSVEPEEFEPLHFVATATAPHVPRPACANGYGLRCMAENVHEWCLDFYARDAYAAALPSDPRGPTEGARRASRGGSWRHKIKFTRVTARSSLVAEYRYNDYGFRVYADAE
jgi:formylglycine-generating enzyme required for sulfatase activity